MPFDIFLFASLLGGAAFSLSGFLVGVRKELDLMGVFILAFLTANGGGVIRDVLLGKTPYALTNMSGFIIVISTFLFGFILYKFKYLELERKRLFVLSDSIGLAAFSLTGALAGIEADLSIFGVVVLSFLTATGGGILRDTLVREIPSVFQSDFYGSVAVLVALAVYGLSFLGLNNDVNIFLVFSASLIIRLIALKMKWHLPRLKFYVD